MLLAPGSKLGTFEIHALLGAGGMGEVYRAHDLKLGRDVAIKILPPAFASDEGRLTRFQTEARTLASLNHPNIAVIHGLEESQGIHYLVMELVEGKTLAECLIGGALSLTEALAICRQIAEALEAPHEKGVVHRDLKPANVKVTPEGRVKVLDFGLAKAFRNEESQDLSQAATLSAVTQEGAIVGTPAYMSPEQVRGRPLDKRADVWAFGCVLYELLTARCAFGENTLPDTIAAVLQREPDWKALPAATPSGVRDLLRRCLQKDSQRRLRDLGDARIAIEDELTTLSEQRGPIEAPTGPAASGQAAGRARPKKKWLAAMTVTLGVLLLGGIAGKWLLQRGEAPEGNPLANAQFTPLTDFKGTETSPAISPNGQFVAFLSNRSGAFDIWLIQANGQGLANLTQGRIGDARAPLRAMGFSADGSEVWSAGIANRRLMLWPLMGGAPHNFLREHAAEVAWSPDGKRTVFHLWDSGDPTYVADSNGLDEHQIVQNEPGLHNHYPVWSRDGRWIYLVRGRPATRETDLWRISTDGKTLDQLSHLNTDIEFPTLLDSRTIVYVAHNENGAGPWLWAFDTETRTSRRVSSGLEQYTAVAASADGQRLVASVVSPQVSLWSIPITKHAAEERDVQSVPLPTTRARAPRFGGSALFYLSSRDGADGLWSYADGQALEIWKGSQEALPSPPAVTADGKTIALALRRNGKFQMHVISNDGTGLRPLTNEVDIRGTSSWSPDGKWIVTGGSDRNGEGLFKIPVDGGAPVRIASGAFLDPVWSPRGDLIVYCGTQVFTVTPILGIHPDGTPVKLPEIHVQRDGERMRFLPDGTGFIYMQGNTLAEQDFWLLDLGAMQSRRLSEFHNPAVMHTFDVSPDGQRIVFDRLQENSGIVLIDLAQK